MSKKLLLFGMLLGMTSLTYAQEDAATLEGELPVVSVVGTKTAKSDKETAKPVLVITQEELQKSLGKDISQVLQEQAGVIINGAYGNPSTTKGVYLRGATGAYTLILVDGIPVNDPSNSSGGAIDLRNISLFNVEQIEVLKGSQSALYGSDAVAGVINIVTKKGEAGKNNVSAFGTVGSLETFKGGVNASGSKDKLTYNVGVSAATSEGMSDAQPRKGDNTDFDDDGYDQVELTANARYDVTDEVYVAPYIRKNSLTYEYDGGGYTDNEDYATSDKTSLGVIGGYKKGKLTTKASFGYSDTDRGFFSGSNSYLYRSYFQEAELFGAYEIKEYLTVAGGVNYQDAKIDGAATGGPNATNELSPFVSFIAKPLSGLIVEASYRFTEHSKFGPLHNYSIAPAYWVNDNIKLFTSYSTGVKAPNVAKLYGPYGNSDLIEQESKSFEIGTQTNWLSNKLKGGIAFYTRKINAPIVYNPVTEKVENEDIQDDLGVEITASYEVLSNLKVSGSYDFLDGKSINEQEGQEDTEERNLYRRPKHSGTVRVDYNPISKLGLGLTAVYMGDRNQLDFSAAGPPTWAAPSVETSSYLLLNAYAQYELQEGKVVVFTDLKNITDNTKFQEAIGYTPLGFNANFGVRVNL